MYDNNTLKTFPLPASLIGLLEDVRDKFADTQKHEQALENYGHNIVLSSTKIKAADLFVYGWKIGTKTFTDYVKKTDTPAAVLMKLLENPGTRSTVQFGIRSLVINNMGGMSAARPDVQDTKKDGIAVLCNVIKEITETKYMRLGDPLIRDLIKYCLIEIGNYYNTVKDKDGDKKPLDKKSAITAADIGEIFSESGLFRVRGEGSELEEYDILMYNYPGANWSNHQTVYTWSQLPTIFRKDQTTKTPAATNFSNLVHMYINTSREAVSSVITFMTNCPRVSHRFGTMLIPFLNGVMEYTGEKAGRMIPWPVVESLHFDDVHYMFIDYKINVNFRYDSFDENTPLPSLPVMVLNEDKPRGLPSLEMTPARFLNQIFEPEEKQDVYQGDELGEQAFAFMLFLRTIMQPFGGWLPCMYFLVDSTGTSNGNNGKGSLIKLISLLATGTDSPTNGPIVPLALAKLCSGGRFVTDIFKSNKYIHVSSENNDLTLKTLDEAKKIFTGDLTDSEGKNQDAKAVKRRAVSLSCFNTVPTFPSDGLDGSYMRRVMVFYCPNSFEGKARPEVENEFLRRADVLEWFAAYAVMKIGCCESHIFDEAYLSRHCPVILENDSEFFGEISIVATWAREVLESDPSYMCNDVYYWEYLYEYSFVPWWNDRNPRAKTVPVQRKKFKKQLALYLRTSKCWAHSLSGSGKRVTNDMITGQPENFLYDHHNFLRDKFPSERIMAAGDDVYNGTYEKTHQGRSSRRELWDRWELLPGDIIRNLCVSMDKEIEKARTGVKRGIIYKKEAYQGGGRFRYGDKKTVTHTTDNIYRYA